LGFFQTPDVSSYCHPEYTNNWIPSPFNNRGEESVSSPAFRKISINDIVVAEGGGNCDEEDDEND
jgi:hypothetical protein